MLGAAPKADVVFWPNAVPPLPKMPPLVFAPKAGFDAFPKIVLPEPVPLLPNGDGLEAAPKPPNPVEPEVAVLDPNMLPPAVDVVEPNGLLPEPNVFDWPKPPESEIVSTELHELDLEQLAPKLNGDVFPIVKRLNESSIALCGDEKMKPE